MDNNTLTSKECQEKSGMGFCERLHAFITEKGLWIDEYKFFLTEELILELASYVNSKANSRYIDYPKSFRHS